MNEPERQTSDVSRFRLVEGNTRSLAALVAIFRRLSVAASLDEIRSVVTHAARTLLDADGITFVLREGDLCHYVEEDAIAPLWKGRRFPMSACVSGWCMNQGRTVAIPDITLDARIPQDAYRATFVKSLIMAPVRQDDPIAAVGAYWSRVRSFAAEDIELLQTVANAAALAMDRIELLAQGERAMKAQLELNHRLQNVLAVIEAMSRQTLRSTKNPETFAEVFSGRLHALARAQGLLYEGGAEAVGLHRLIREQSSMGAPDDRLRCDGPTILLKADLAFDLGLLLHELGTNARKYGALSNGKGRVEIAWRLDGAAPREILELTWRELGGPPVAEPSRGGFGSALLRMAFKKDGGEARVHYAADGLICDMRIPLV